MEARPTPREHAYDTKAPSLNVPILPCSATISLASRIQLSEFFEKGLDDSTVASL
jgi:hypothetical protein